MPINFRFNIKTRLIISGVLFALGIFIILQISLFQIQDISSAQAASAQNVRGWGWSENIGWISMNCYNDYDNDGDFANCCPGSPGDAECPFAIKEKGHYGVHYDDRVGYKKLTGYAWSDNVGWICFGETCQTVCLGGTNNGVACTTDSNCLPGGECGGQPPHGLPVSWACVGNPGWYCTDGGNACKYNSQCILWEQGLCRFSCSGDEGEDFVDSEVCVRSNHLKAHWNMNNLSEGTIVDDSVNSNVGTLMPVSTPPIQIQGKFSNALQFDGTEDYIEVADSESLSVTGNLTIEAWIKRSSIGDGLIGEQTIIGKWDELAGIKSYRLWFDINNRLNFTVSDGTKTATITQKDGICLGLDAEVTQCTSDDDCATGEICKNAPITDTGKWHHVAGKYISWTSVNAPSLQIFIDGSKIPTSAVEGIIPDTLTDTTEKFYIGATPGKTTYFNGIIDNVSVWSCQNLFKIRGRSKKEIWDDAKIEIDGWARVINLGEKGWLKLKGFTKDGRVWGSSLDNYSTFYTFNGYMGNRWVDESMNSDGLIAHWKMNEPDWDGTTDEVVDSENTNHGTAYNEVNVTNEGIFNSAGDFDGDNDYVGLSSNLTSLNDFTIIGWIKLDDLATTETNGNNPLWSGADGRLLMRPTGYYFQFYDFPASGGTATNINSWVHIAVVRNDSTVTYYRNKDYVTSWDVGSNPVSFASSRLGNQGGYWFNGFIDNVAIYNRALLPIEILAAYNKRIPACAGWGDYEHDYDDPPNPLPFNSLSVSNPDNCEELLAYWDSSTWAEYYTYWRCDDISSESGCSSCEYTERTILDALCNGTCQLKDDGLTPNTGYCYKIQAHNETGSTWGTDTPPIYPAPYWRSTTLCFPTGLESDADTCGQVTLTWDRLMVCNGGTKDGQDCTLNDTDCLNGGGTCIGDLDVDGYNIYRSLAESGLSSCDSLTYDGCELTGHLAEALDYKADNGATNDLIAQWKMNETGWTGDVDEVKDFSTQTPLNNGTAGCIGVDCEKPTTVAGIFDKAGSFNGDDYVSVSDNSDLDLSNNLTISGWINNSSQSSSKSDYKVLVIYQGVSGHRLEDKYVGEGYDVTVDTGATNLTAVQAYNPDIVVCDRYAWACSYSFLNTLYNNGYSIASMGNDTGSTIYPISTSHGVSGVAAGTIIPDEKHPITNGWSSTGGSGSDGRQAIDTISLAAFSIAKDNTNGWTEIVYLEEPNKGRWVHYQPHASPTTVLFDNANEFLLRDSLINKGKNYNLFTSMGNLYGFVNAQKLSTNVSYNTWNYAVLKYDFSDIYLYLNGVQKSSSAYSTALDTDNTNLCLGSYVNGQIDNVSIYNVAKSEEQIKIDYEAGTNPNCDSGQCGLAYVCDDGTEPHDKCGKANTCCYTDSRIIPYINYYYRITATGETGETPSTGIGPAQTICFPALEEEEE